LKEDAAVISPHDAADQRYEFVGGPYDGRQLDVVPPPQEGIELVVHAVGRLAPAEFYILEADGRFHYNTPPEPRPLAALSGD
jgi:hypothetical protein